MRVVEKRLRERIKSLEKELDEVKRDREGFRNSLVNNLKEAIRIHGLGQYWIMPHLIETFAKNISQRNKWYW